MGASEMGSGYTSSQAASFGMGASSSSRVSATFGSGLGTGSANMRGSMGGNRAQGTDSSGYSSGE